MIFLATMPLVFAFMNVAVPLQIGARDVAFPFLNSLGFWLFFFGGVFLNLSWFLGGAPDAGWTSYASLSLASKGHGIDFYVLGLQISGLGTLIGGINFLVTIINMRAPGMTYMRMPMFTWTTFVTSSLILFAFPPLTVGLGLLMLDRLFGTSFFQPSFGREYDYMGALILDLWAPRSVHSYTSSFRNILRNLRDLFQKTIIRIFIDGICNSLNWIFRIYGMGAPYVYSWSRPCC